MPIRKNTVWRFLIMISAFIKVNLDKSIRLADKTFFTRINIASVSII